ncbi:hypothetical protein [Dyella choica]|uniref:Uncharacterized protein n=1 Tax=Dyella choica TaxID=1927959 RepID=A0A3S0PN85_9GAMM|nr:hypothetical protein [Dyella choica]RUL76831.1 hypothetical protein EKH80_08990 [Dyella choica]
MKNKLKGLSWFALSMILVPVMGYASPDDGRQVVLNGVHTITLDPASGLDVDYFICSSSSVPTLTVNHASGYPLVLQIKPAAGAVTAQKTAMKDGDYVEYLGRPQDMYYTFTVINPSSTRPQTITATVNASCRPKL